MTPTVAEWLGPLAPVALSPFFGVTLLSGLAIAMDKGVVPENRLLARAAPLRSPALFAVFAALAMLTSLPRLTKVSKPLVQALDVLETWSIVVVMLLIRSLAVRTNTDQEVAMMTAGVLSVTTNGLLMVVGALNMRIGDSRGHSVGCGCLVNTLGEVLGGANCKVSRAAGAPTYRLGSTGF